MERYIQYLVGVEGIERAKLFQEAKDLENEVWALEIGIQNNQAMAFKNRDSDGLDSRFRGNDDEEKINRGVWVAQVAQADKDYRLIKKGLDFKLNVEEWKEYVSRAEEIESGMKNNELKRKRDSK